MILRDEELKLEALGKGDLRDMFWNEGGEEECKRLAEGSFSSSLSLSNVAELETAKSKGGFGSGGKI